MEWTFTVQLTHERSRRPAYARSSEQATTIHVEEYQQAYTMVQKTRRDSGDIDLLCLEVDAEESLKVHNSAEAESPRLMIAERGIKTPRYTWTQ